MFDKYGEVKDLYMPKDFYTKCVTRTACGGHHGRTARGRASRRRQPAGRHASGRGGRAQRAKI